MDSTIAEPLGPDDPREIGQFPIIGVLGTGGMGEVYLGTVADGYVAIKRVRARLVTSERFKREVGLLYRVPPGVAPSVLANDSTVSRPWFATEYVPGLTVDEAVRLHGPLPADSLWLMLSEIAVQLQAVHDAGIVHRDLKPANVMVMRGGVKLIDFGIARAVDQERLTRRGAGFGTYGFSAPEQENGDSDANSPADVYALGALLLYAASGRVPGVAANADGLRGVDADLADVIEPCLSIDPKARPTAQALAEAAREHIADAELDWPDDVRERIDERWEFANTPVSAMETLPPPETVDPGTADQKAERQSGEAEKRDEERPQERRSITERSITERSAAVEEVAQRSRTKTVLVPAVAALAVGGLAVLFFVPSLSPLDDNTQAKAQVSSTLDAGSSPATTGKTGTASPRPDGSASASGSASPHGTGSASSAGGQGSGGTVVTYTTAPANGSGGNTATGGSGGTQSGGGSGGTGGTGANPGPSPTASPIPAINGTQDSQQVSGSEADTDVQFGDAACSAWLDSNGSGLLSGLVNTSLYQSCTATLHWSNGKSFQFGASTQAARTNWLSDAGTSMWICVYDQSSPSDQTCGAAFTMNGDSPVRQ